MSLFRLHPLIYWIGGLLIIAFAGFMYVHESEANAAKAEALAGEPPSAVMVDKFDPTLNSNGAKEAVVIGEIGLDAAYILTTEKDGEVTKTQWVAPLRPVAQIDDRKTITHGVFETSGSMPREKLISWSETDGVDGPVARIHGVWVKPGYGDRKEIVEAFGEKGLTLAEDAVFFDPFMDDRETELAAKDPIEAASILGGGGALVFLYGFIRSFLRRRR